MAPAGGKKRSERNGKTPVLKDGASFGVVDIGSNTVRLVIFKRLGRIPLPICNEKMTCGLGHGLQETGMLNPDGKAQALKAIARYARLASLMGIAPLDLVATAAVRDASDGPDFVREIEAITKTPVTVLAGDEEARMAALGVISALPKADGMVADLGGGSLELIMIKGGTWHKPSISLPLGLLRLTEAANNSMEEASRILDQHFDKLTWLKEARGKSLYVVGGAWRALARVCIDRINYPLHVLDNFALPHDEAMRLIPDICQMSHGDLSRVEGVSDKRVPGLPFAALILKHLLERVQPKTLVFSVYGMREGRFYLHLGPQETRQDPLISSCEALACGAGRFPSQGRELMKWMDPLFENESRSFGRLRLAACLIGDVFWSEHPDYRAQQAFHKAIKLPFMGLSHLERAALALCLYYRYTNDPGDNWVFRAESMLAPKIRKHMRNIGQALRLGYTINGGASGLLEKTSLSIREGELLLKLGNDPAFVPDLFSKRLSQLAKGLGLKARLVVRD